MGGKFGKNEWKVKLVSGLAVAVIVAVILGVGIGGCSLLKPKYEEFKEAKEQREAEEHAQLEAEQDFMDDSEIAANTGVADGYHDAWENVDELDLMGEQTGEQMEAQSAPEITTGSVLDQEYIFYDSDSRYLTSSDVEGMTLQEINYAKNEIYARKGRIFKAAELQQYFSSKSWYLGTVAPEDFSDGMLNDYERSNAKFLSDVEHSMNSNGYQPK